MNAVALHFATNLFSDHVCMLFILALRLGFIILLSILTFSGFVILLGQTFTVAFVHPYKTVFSKS